METHINPELAAALAEFEAHPELHAKNQFAIDVIDKYRRYGTVTAAQVTHLTKSLARDREMASRPGVLAPEGYVVVTGTVVSVKPKDTAYGRVLKMLVKLDDGAKVYASVPKGHTISAGDVVTFSATFKRSDTDPAFSFGSRPEMVTGDVGGVDAPPPMKTKQFNAPKAGPSILAGLLAELGDITTEATEGNDNA